MKPKRMVPTKLEVMVQRWVFLNISYNLLSVSLYSWIAAAARYTDVILSCSEACDEERMMVWPKDGCIEFR